MKTENDLGVSSLKKKNQWTPENLRALLADKRSGLTLNQLASKYSGISTEAVRQALAKAERREKAGRL